MSRKKRGGGRLLSVLSSLLSRAHTLVLHKADQGLVPGITDIALLFSLSSLSPPPLVLDLPFKGLLKQCSMDLGAHFVEY